MFEGDGPRSHRTRPEFRGRTLNGRPRDSGFGGRGDRHAGVKVGGLVGRAMNAGLDRITARRGGGPIVSVMAELSMVLQTLDQVGRGIAEVIDSVHQAQAHFQKVSRGGGNNLLNSAVRACRQAPVRLEEGVDEVKQAQELVGKHLVAVATAGG